MAYEFFIGTPPFNEPFCEDIFERIVNRDFGWPDDFTVPDVAKDLINQLLTLEPEHRLGSKGANEVKNHPFFNGIDWENLHTCDMKDIFVPNLKNSEDTSYHWDRKELYGSIDAVKSDGTNSSEIVDDNFDENKSNCLPGFDFKNVTELVATNKRLVKQKTKKETKKL
eukprot:TRINITY_DN3017_c0_g1_i1.p1 TRINITY_DN3017_c0_g1~~TRINITY_DN3017_c0_g1_i1.p1  ORF type:complete len:168 (+),score=26.78 TRINITY_DN3017_c0_g1_i1:84-587(+)